MINCRGGTGVSTERSRGDEIVEKENDSASIGEKVKSRMDFSKARAIQGDGGQE